MKQFYYSSISMILIFSVFLIHAEKRYAVIKKPVIDLFGSHTLQKEIIPAATQGSICTRINQALFNEAFEIVHTDSKMTSIIIPWAIYGYDTTGKAQNRYWARTRDIKILSDTKNAPGLLSLPSFQRPEDVVTLIRPFTNARGVTYSIGTQFVRSCKQPYKKTIRVHHTHGTYDIPTKKVLEYKKYTSQEARKMFVELIRRLIEETSNQSNANTIPYVWGGSSFTKPYSSTFTKINDTYHRKERETIPLCGYDCSALVLRFAHMLNIPYVLKTTAALEKYGKPLLPGDQLQVGDLIWLQGHVAFVADVQNNLIIESSGYSNKVGKVRLVPLNQFLKTIHTFEDLLRAYHNKEIVVRLNNDRSDFKESPVKIFKLL